METFFAARHWWPLSDPQKIASMYAFLDWAQGNLFGPIARKFSRSVWYFPLTHEILTVNAYPF